MNRASLIVRHRKRNRSCFWYATLPPSTTSPTETTQSYLGVPIMVNNKVIGTVAIQSYKQHAYNENSLRLLQTLASNMGVAIQNARLFEAEQERVAELQIINSIQQGLAAELDFQAIVDLVGDKLREVFNTPDLGINWYDEKTNFDSLSLFLRTWGTHSHSVNAASFRRLVRDNEQKPQAGYS
ncbi:MAG: GAF domain-containing protein [Anaerolineales bacterium]